MRCAGGGSRPGRPQPRTASSASAAADITSIGADVPVHSSKESAACCRSRPSPPNAGAPAARAGEQRRRGRVVEEVDDEASGPQGGSGSTSPRTPTGVAFTMRSARTPGASSNSTRRSPGRSASAPRSEGPRRFPHGDGQRKRAGPRDGQGRGARRPPAPYTSEAARPGRTPRPCAGIARSRNVGVVPVQPAVLDHERVHGPQPPGILGQLVGALGGLGLMRHRDVRAGESGRHQAVQRVGQRPGRYRQRHVDPIEPSGGEGRVVQRRREAVVDGPPDDAAWCACRRGPSDGCPQPRQAALSRRNRA